MVVEVSRLSNGLTVATEYLPNFESVALGIWVKSGARNESDDEHGIAHLLEHMAFKGTERRSAWQIASEIENVGGEINAATSVETTSFYARVLSNDVPLAVDILADILTEVQIRRRRARARAACDPAGDRRRARHAGRHRLRPLHRDGVPPPDDRPLHPRHAGDGEILHLQADLHSFLDKQYGAERMVAVAAGDIRHEDFVREVEARFGAFRSRAVGVPPQYCALCRRRLPREPRPDGCADHSRLRGPRLPCPRLLCLAGAFDDPRRRHVVAAVPGSAREARAVLLGLCLPLGLFRHRHLRRSRRDRTERHSRSWCRSS